MNRPGIFVKALVEGVIKVISSPPFVYRLTSHRPRDFQFKDGKNETPNTLGTTGYRLGT